MALQKGVVLKRVKGFYKVLAENGKIQDCKIKRRLFKDSKYDNQAVAGDWVEFSKNQKGEYDWIHQILPRTNYFARRRVEINTIQVIASNMDQLFIFTSYLEPAFRKNLVIRMILSAKLGGIKPIVVINKRDLADEELQEKVKSFVEVLSVDWFSYSNLVESDREEILERIQDKKTLICGHSGVGKSSMIHRIFPDKSIRIAGINERIQKGKHTTTFTEIYLVNNQTWLVDTPGIREFDPFVLSRLEVAHHFPILSEYKNQCKFKDCLHLTEPDCVVKKAVEDGTIPHSVYQSYKDFLQE